MNIARDYIIWTLHWCSPLYWNSDVILSLLVVIHIKEIGRLGIDMALEINQPNQEQNYSVLHSAD